MRLAAVSGLILVFMQGTLGATAGGAVPEVDPSSVSGGLAVFAATVVILRARRSK